jgi:hypothetical protein
MVNRKTTRRAQLELAEKSMERLEDLKDKTKATSYAEVVKNALRLYESMILKHAEGNRFLLKNSQGVVTEYEVFY